MLYSRFGVTLDVQQYDFDPGAGEALINRFVNSWTPSISPNASAGVGVGYVVDDWYGYHSTSPTSWTHTYEGGNLDGNTSNEPATVTKPQGGEGFDVEAIYMTNDERAIYISIITSMPPPPGLPTGGSTTIMSGDLAIHTPVESGVHSGEYAYGVDINHADEGQDPDTYEDLYDTDATIGEELYKTDFDGLGESTDDWYVGNFNDAAFAGEEETNFNGEALPSSQLVGDATDGVVVNYIDTGLLEGYEPGVTDSNASTWEIDVVLPIHLFPEYDNLEYGEKRDIGVQYIPGCRNDGNAADINMRLDYEYTDVPEPGTLAMAGLGLLGLAFLKRRRDAKKAAE